MAKKLNGEASVNIGQGQGSDSDNQDTKDWPKDTYAPWPVSYSAIFLLASCSSWILKRRRGWCDRNLFMELFLSL